jgi:tRNA A37 threonylcarbamoyladenosine biosynthesis protein TsaE
VFSRAKETQEIVHKVATMDKNNRLIHVHGEDGNGKSDITNYAARYALEGRVKLDAAFHIKIEQITT